MEEVVGASCSNLGSIDEKAVCVKGKTLQAVLEQCQRALELLGSSEGAVYVDDDDDREGDGAEPSRRDSVAPCQDREADEFLVEKRSLQLKIQEHPENNGRKLCELVKSRVESPEFLEKLECAQALVPQNEEEGDSWDMVNDNDLWQSDNADLDTEDYVLVRQEDIVEGIACFMAAYLSSLNQTNELNPDQLQAALSKTFAAKKKKGKLRKAWDGSKVICNLASWGATAIGIYQNPVILRAASNAFWTSCHVISKFL